MKNFAIDYNYRPFHGSPRPCARAITLLCALAMVFSGCTTTRTLDANGGTAVSGQPKAGDTVHVVLRDGEEMDLSFVEWNDEQLVGMDKNDQSQSIYRSDIVQMETKEMSDGLVKTLAFVGIILLLAISVSSAFELPGAEVACC
jgi:hypothetical protein